MPLKGLIIKPWEKFFCCNWSEDCVMEGGVATNVLNLNKQVTVIFCNIHFLVFLEFEDKVDGPFVVGGGVMGVRTFLVGFISIDHCSITGGGGVQFCHHWQVHMLLLLHRSYRGRVPWCKVQQPIQDYCTELTVR